MTRGPSIQGIGVVGGFGAGISALQAALRTGHVVPGALTVRNHSIPAYLADLTPLDEFVPRRNLRRVDRFSQLALLGASLALRDAGRSVSDCGRLGLIVASGYGPMRTTFAFLDSYLDGGDICSSPTHFSNSVHNAAAANIAILLGIDGPNLTISQFEMSVHAAMMTACHWLQRGLVDSVLVGGVDECCEVLGYCWERFFGIPDGPLQPLAFDRQTAIPGEGAGFMLLDRETLVRYGYLVGVRMGMKEIPLPEKTSQLILGADGHRECGRYYLERLDQSVPMAGYAHLYGSLPIAPIFDLSVVALSGKEGRHFPCPFEISNTYKACGGMPIADNKVDLFKFEKTGGGGALAIEFCF